MSLVENLIYNYGDFQLHIERWNIPDAGVTVLWGPSGSGKSSVLRHLLGLEKAAGFRWIFQGIDLATLPPPKRNIGVVFQSLELFPHMTALENIQFAAKARRIERNEIQRRLADLDQILHLSPFLSRSVQNLSGGERQRVAFARAVIARPRILLLDEPFSALDEMLRTEARAFLLSLVRQQNLPTLLVTHDPRDVEVLAEKVSLLQNGRIVDGL